tara:strand:+ start:7567 stop:7743 length:177 start_codon:yes stop_codon:yes gene_type:complete
MKLQSQKHFEYKDKKYEKYWIVIPNKDIEKLKWKKGDELVSEVKNDEITIKKVTKIVE